MPSFLSLWVLCTRVCPYLKRMDSLLWTLLIFCSIHVISIRHSLLLRGSTIQNFELKPKTFKYLKVFGFNSKFWIVEPLSRRLWRIEMTWIEQKMRRVQRSESILFKYGQTRVHKTHRERKLGITESNVGHQKVWKIHRAGVFLFCSTFTSFFNSINNHLFN